MPSISIEQLYNAKKISRRTYNFLSRLGVQTLDELTSKSNYELSKQPGAGNKTLSEINVLKATNPESIDLEENEIHKYIQTTIFDSQINKTSVNPVSKTDFFSTFIGFECAKLIADSDTDPLLPDEYEFKQIFGCEPSEIGPKFLNVPLLVEFAFTQSQELAKKGFHFILRLIESLNDKLNDGSQEKSSLKSVKEYITCRQAFFDIIPLALSLPNEHKALITQDFHNRLDNMSVHVSNVLCKTEGFKKIIELIFSDRYFDDNRIRNCGKKIHTTWLNYSLQYRAELSRAIQLLASEDNGKAEQFAQTWHNKLNFPFLTDAEAGHAADLYIKYGTHPVIMLLTRFIYSLDDNQGYIIRKIFGYGMKPLSVQEVANEMGMTDQNIRNYVRRKLPVSSYLYRIASEQLSPLGDTVITESNPLWKELAEKSEMPFKPREFMALHCLLFQTHKLEIVEGKWFLVDREVSATVRIQMVMAAIRNKLERKYLEPVTIDIPELIREGAPESNFDPKYRELSVIYSCILQKQEFVEIVNDYQFTILPNKLNRMGIIENIVKEAGREITPEEVTYQILRAHPTLFITEASVKSYMIRSQNIVAKGKSGLYIHKDNVSGFIGTITDFLAFVLESSENPMSLADLLAEVKKLYPNTTRSSINTLMSLDTKKRFYRVVRDYFGIVGKDYSNFELPERDPQSERRSRSSYMFNKLEQLKQFISSHSAIPMHSGDEEEKKLRTWMDGVMARDVINNEDIRKEIGILLNDASVARNAREIEFMEMCRRVAKIVRYSRKQLDESHMEEYTWLKRNLLTESEHNEFRRHHFKQLLQLLVNEKLNEQ